MWFSGPDLQTDEYEDNQLLPDPFYRDELKCVFINNIKAKDSCNKDKYLTADELNTSTEFLARIAQLSEFKAEIDALEKGSVLKTSKLKALDPFLDENTLLRFGGRLSNADLPFEAKHQIIIPKVYWGTSNAGKSAIRDSNSKCTILKLWRNFCGPFQIKFKNQRKRVFSKVNVVIFVCLATKAIHLEAMTDLTTEAFIVSLKRLCAHRGRISTLMPDNATNFKGAVAELNRFIKLICNKNETLANYFASEAIQWKFIPSPRGCILNSRPLVPLSDNINEYEVLTLGHFIIGRPIIAIPEPSILDISDNRLSRWQYTTKMATSLVMLRVQPWMGLIRMGWPAPSVQT
ncbi:integrase catalytic domain-containing protein [Trichonephila clavipes]|nr:integrase catalytic domain-containing protein [Trichonephila clavipes]